jgi:hypothetical protein
VGPLATQVRSCANQARRRLVWEAALLAHEPLPLAIGPAAPAIHPASSRFFPLFILLLTSFDLHLRVKTTSHMKNSKNTKQLKIPRINIATLVERAKNIITSSSASFDLDCSVSRRDAITWQQKIKTQSSSKLRYTRTHRQECDYNACNESK